MKAGTSDRIAWAMELLVDFLVSGSLKADQLAIRYLSGQIAGSGGKGVVDLLCLKKEVLGYIVSNFMDAHTYTTQERTLMRDITTDLETFRSRCGYSYNASLKKAMQEFGTNGIEHGFCLWRVSEKQTMLSFIIPNLAHLVSALFLFA